MTKPKRIFVVGHMGTGRFLFAEALANKLAWQIVDANPSIERYIGRTTRQILGEQGEAAFNQCQADIILHCIGKENIVVLLEECVVTREQCRALLSDEFVVFLQASIPTQIGRMKGGRVPSLPVDNMQQFLEQQHLERDALYEQVANLTVESEGYSDQESEVKRKIDEDTHKVITALESIAVS